MDLNEAIARARAALDRGDVKTAARWTATAKSLRAARKSSGYAWASPSPALPNYVKGLAAPPAASPDFIAYPGAGNNQVGVPGLKWK